MKRHNDYLSVYGVGVEVGYLNHCEEASFDMELVFYIYIVKGKLQEFV